MKVVVVGAGVGGLCAALALRQHGCDVEVYERAPAIRPVGAGLALQPNAIVALRALGVGEAVEKVGSRLRLADIVRADGRPITRIPKEMVQAVRDAVGADAFGIHRATLHEVLLDATGRDSVHLGRAATGYQLGERVVVRFAAGETVECDALIGADGLHSAIRDQLLGHEEPTYSGYTSWRGITPTLCGREPGEAVEAYGRGLRFGGASIDGGRYYWFAVANAPAGEHDAPGTTKSGLLERFRGFGSGTAALIEATPEEAIVRTDIADRPPVTRWGEGRMTLLGDAAHPMTPNLGQGACQAIEDALVLGMEWAREPSVENALRAYEAKRQPRANQFVVRSRRIGAVAQWEGAFAAGVRDWVLGLTPAAAMKSQLEWAWTLPY